MECAPGVSADTNTALCPNGGKCCHKTSAVASIRLQVPLLTYETANNIYEYMGNIYTTALYIIVPITIVIIIMAGLQWVSAAGNTDTIRKAKSLIINGFIGLGIALFSYVILSIVGISSIQGINPEYIPSIEVNNETPGYDQCDATIPRCTGSDKTTYQSNLAKSNLDLLIKPAQAGAAKVPLLKQWQPPLDKTPYGNICGTVKSAGCGPTSFTMLLKYMGFQAEVKDIAAKAHNYNYRPCTSPKWDAQKEDCVDCAGTSNKAFVSGSKLLNDYNLKGEDLGGCLSGKPINPKILEHLAKGEPIIISLSATEDQKKKGNEQYARGVQRKDINCGNPYTCAAHYVVLTGCDGCDKNKDAVIYMNDPNHANTQITQADLTKYLKFSSWIHK
jgi:hypothetical protein